MVSNLGRGYEQLAAVLLPVRRSRLEMHGKRVLPAFLPAAQSAFLATHFTVNPSHIAQMLLPELALRAALALAGETASLSLPFDGSRAVACLSIALAWWATVPRQILAQSCNLCSTIFLLLFY